MALGSDYGLVLWDGRRFQPFPFPAGARREARSVVAMACHQGELWVATTRCRFRWHPGMDSPEARGFPRDVHGEIDDLRALIRGDAGWIFAWRTQLEGAEGPGNVQAMCFDGEGALWLGTLDGQLRIAGASVQRQWEDPVRHLAWAAGRLWVAASGGLHVLKAGRWEQLPGEPLALQRDGDGLWLLRHEGLAYAYPGEGPRPVEAPPLSRPWSMAPDGAGQLWVGEQGRVRRLALSPEASRPMRAEHASPSGSASLDP